MTLEHDKVRTELVEATLQLMDEGGLDAVKARSIAERVGVSVGTIYNLFGNVDGLVEAAISDILAELGALGKAALGRIDAELADKTSAGEWADTLEAAARYRLLELSRLYIEFVAAHGSRWAALLAFSRSRPVEQAPDHYLNQVSGLIDIVGQVLATSPLQADASQRALAARALWSAVHGIVTLNMAGNGSAAARADASKQIELIIGYFTHGLYAADR